jgi:hypothetical protein
MASLFVHKRFRIVSGKKPFPAFSVLPQYIRMLRLPSTNVLYKLSNITNLSFYVTDYKEQTNIRKNHTLEKPRDR